MDTTTQPILCCIGETVAGQPTQFLMERAFAAGEIDWRAITVEVTAEEFGAAMDGMTAMNFNAVRFFPSVGSKAAEKLCKGNAWNGFVRQITSAKRVAQSWQTWDHHGFAILDLLAERTTQGQQTVWIHGDGLLQRSFFAALATKEDLATKKKSKYTITWTAPPSDLKTLPLESLSSTIKLACPETAAHLLADLNAASSQENANTTLVILGQISQFVDSFPTEKSAQSPAPEKAPPGSKDMSEHRKSPDPVDSANRSGQDESLRDSSAAANGTASSRQAESSEETVSNEQPGPSEKTVPSEKTGQADKPEQTVPLDFRAALGDWLDRSIEQLILIDEHPLDSGCATEIQVQQFRDIASIDLPNTQPLETEYFSSIDISVAADAHDCKRWTGVAVERSLLRDAYDEYCDF